MLHYDAPVLGNGSIAATTAAFEVKGGYYQAAVVATFTAGSVKLQKLMPDGVTYASVGGTTDFTTAGIANVYLAPGQYRWLITTATAVFTELARIPTE